MWGKKSSVAGWGGRRGRRWQRISDSVRGTGDILDFVIGGGGVVAILLDICNQEKERRRRWARFGSSLRTPVTRVGELPQARVCML